MAKNWEIKDGIVTRTYESKDATGKVIDSAPAWTFDLRDLFPDYDTYNEAQQGTIWNGVKQKLDDACARSKAVTLSETEKRDIQTALWTRLTVDGKWNMEGTGTRGPSVSLKTLVPALLAAGLDTKAIATATGKSLEDIEKFIATGEEN